MEIRIINNYLSFFDHLEYDKTYFGKTAVKILSL
jgi:hypothetical protein